MLRKVGVLVTCNLCVVQSLCEVLQDWWISLLLLAGPNNRDNFMKDCTGLPLEWPQALGFAMTDLSVIARVVHEAIRAFQQGLGEPAAEPWDKAEAWQRESTLAGVRFRIENPDAPPSAQHDQWAEEKRAAGWIYGTVKDAGGKTHPSLVPFDALPESERRKDALFAAIVRALSDRI